MYSILIGIDNGEISCFQKLHSFDNLKEAYKECMELRIGGVIATIIDNQKGDE